MYTRNKLFITFNLLVFLTIISACASEQVAPVEQQNIVWPSSPSVKAKFRYVRSFSKPIDLGIGRGFLKWLSDVFTGEDNPQLIRPMSVVVTSNNIIYVADPGAHGVHRFDVDAGHYKLIIRADDKTLPSPVALALGPDNSVYVSDSELATVFQIKNALEIAQPILLKARFQQPTGIAYAQDSQRIFVADTAKHQIRIFNPDGSDYKSIGQRGSMESEFNFPTYIWVDELGKLYVTDSLNFRVQIFTGEGQFLKKFGKLGDGSGNFSRPKGIAVDKNGHIFVVDALFNAVQIFNQQGGLLLPIGSRGQHAGEFWLPAGIFINKDEIFIADSHNQRVQVLRYIGESK